MDKAALIAAVASAVVIIDGIVGQTKLTGRAKNIAHLMCIGLIAMAKAIGDALTTDMPPTDKGDPQ